MHYITITLWIWALNYHHLISYTDWTAWSQNACVMHTECTLWIQESSNVLRARYFLKTKMSPQVLIRLCLCEEITVKTGRRSVKIEDFLKYVHWFQPYVLSLPVHMFSMFSYFFYNAVPLCFASKVNISDRWNTCIRDVKRKLQRYK